jgi:hypothetical protein
MDGRGQAPGPQAYPTMRNKFGPPMTLANMRLNGVRAVIATCAGRPWDSHALRHGVDVDRPPCVRRLRLRCSSCGGKRISTR